MVGVGGVATGTATGAGAAGATAGVGGVATGGTGVGAEVGVGVGTGEAPTGVGVVGVGFNSENFASSTELNIGMSWVRPITLKISIMFGFALIITTCPPPSVILPYQSVR